MRGEHLLRWASLPAALETAIALCFNGKVAYKGGPGPRGFDPREMDQELKKLLGK